MAADLPEGAQLVDDLLALVDAEGVVVRQRGQHRIEVVGFLGDVDEGDAHG
jgi:hypothetical protein